MDPVSLILGAVMAGASAGLGDTVSTTIKDAHEALKALLRKRLHGDAKAEAAFDGFQEDPETWRKPLAKELAASGAAGDDDVIAAARRLLALADPEGTAKGKYSVSVTGGKGIVVGDNAQVIMTFTED